MKIESEKDKIVFSELGIFADELLVEIREAVKKEMLKRIFNEFTIKDEKKDIIKMFSNFTLGFCPYCNAFIREYKCPTGSFAPEAWARLRDNNIDPTTGHLETCKHKEIRL